MQDLMERKIKKGSNIFEYDMTVQFERRMFFRDLEAGFKELKEWRG